MFVSSLDSYKGIRNSYDITLSIGAVRKVKMALDAPTGCSFALIKSPKVKMETVRRQFANLQSKVSSGWRAVRNIHFSPRVPANGSFSRHSLAYMQASTQYIKQVSGLLKVGVSTLRSSSSGYEVQGIWLFILFWVDYKNHTLCYIISPCWVCLQTCLH